MTTSRKWQAIRMAVIPVGLAWALGACAAAKYTTTTDRHSLAILANSDDATKRDHGVEIAVVPVGAESTCPNVKALVRIEGTTQRRLGGDDETYYAEPRKLTPWPVFALAGAFLGGFGGFMNIYYRVTRDMEAERRRRGTPGHGPG